MRSQEDVIVVVSEPKDLIEVPSAISADDYLAGRLDTTREKATVVNLCRSWRYLSKGYYVSLLADARGQSVIPNIETVESLASTHAVFRVMLEGGVPTVDLDEVNGRRRAPPENILAGDGLSQQDDPEVPLVREGIGENTVYRPARAEELAEAVVYFGHCADSRFQRIGSLVYRLLPTPILKLRLILEEDAWKVFHVQKLKVQQLNAVQHAEMVKVLVDRTERLSPTPPPEEKRASIAILYDVHDQIGRAHV